MRNIQPGQTLMLSDHNGNVTYQVDQIQVVDSAVTRLRPTAFPDGLILVTCYPFDALTAGGTQRLVVMASAVEPEKPPVIP